MNFPASLKLGFTQVLAKHPMLVRRGLQVGFFYGASVLVEKILDAAHEKFPENKTLGKADYIAHAVVNSENFIFGGIGAAGGMAYEAIPNGPQLKNAPRASVDPGIELPGPATELIPAMNASELAMPAVLSGREVPAIAGVQATRNRANLSTQLEVPIPPERPAPVLADDGLPVEGAYEAKTGITWGEFHKPNARTKNACDLMPRF